MSYVAPNSSIYLISNVYLSNDYSETILFESEVQQRNYFFNKREYRFEEQSYQRLNSGRLKLKINAEELLESGCNYLMFSNPDRAERVKWYYCFIVNINYINENTTEITYQIDVLQTYMFDYRLEECFVEREHASTDEVGDNILPEDFDLGEYVDVITYEMERLKRYAIIVATNIGLSWDESTGEWLPGLVGGGVYDGMYNGLYLSGFVIQNEDGTISESEMNRLHKFIAWAGFAEVLSPYRIVAMYYVPLQFLPIPTSSSLTPSFSSYYPIPTSIGNYIPRNKKLLTFPFNFIEFSNNHGGRARYRYEFFKKVTLQTGENIQFVVAGLGQLNPSILLIPKNYKNIENNYDESLTLDKFPQCSWSSETFMAYLAQLAGETAMSLGFAFGEAEGAGNFAYERESAINANNKKPLPESQIEDIAQAAYDRSLNNSLEHISRSVSKGLTNALQNGVTTQGTSPSVLKMKMGLCSFIAHDKQITEEYARRIDDYFSRFGYATKKVKVPNTNVRAKWTYTKTIGCNIKSGIPHDFSEKICDIFDNGITFWKYNSNIDNEIGNYGTLASQNTII